ncbi:MAG: hypothetical protein GY754_31175 [bacterium]|nr:hypothetical protein [bacterium]
MQEFVYIKDLVIIFALAIVIVTLLHRLKIPAIAAFILSGMIIGPKGIGLIDDMHQVEVLAEVGVALLLFSIGLELSLESIKKLYKPILFGGLLQVGLSIGLGTLISYSLDLSVSSALMVGFIVTLSSTAIVLRGLESRGEVDAPHGRLTLGILIFQDMAVIPMMLIIPLLRADAQSGYTVFFVLGKALVVVVAVFLASRILVPKILAFVTKTRQRELFNMTVILICLGTAWFTSLAGISLGLGAFLAGIVVADSQYKHQAVSDLISIKDLFTSLFFISVGMLLAPSLLLKNSLFIVLLLAAVIAGKFIIVFITAVIMRLPLRVAILASISLAQIGEFSFLLIGTIQKNAMLENELINNLIAVAILSMFLTPFLITLGPRLAAGAVKIKVLNKLLSVPTALDACCEGKEWEDHVIIAGYGYTGATIAQLLRKSAAQYLVVDLNIENIIKAKKNGDPAFFGDVTSQDVLDELAIEKARELVLVINDQSAVERSIKAARTLAPGLSIIARTRYIQEIEPLMAAGATRVIAAEKESAEALALHVINIYKS